MNEPSVIVLEFNELTPRLMHRWMDEGKLPGFKRFYQQSMAYTTDAQEPTASLEPWIQWVTVHSGLSYQEHGIFDLGDGHKLKAPRVWDVLSDAGKRVWVCGSMNAGVQSKKINGAILPDPWSTGFEPYPASQFNGFLGFIQTNVREYTRRDVPLGLMDYVRFGLFMARNGLSFKTIIRTAKQLLSERGGKFHWRRAMILDRLIWDVFRANWKKIKPHYATVFLNSTAHLQHYHWRNMAPSEFSLKPPAGDQAEFENAILAGYQAMDDVVVEAMDLVKGSNTSLVMMSALSQQALTTYDQSGGKQLFKSIDPQQLLAFAGVTDAGRYEPVMAEEFRIVFETNKMAEDAQKKLMALQMNGQAVLISRCDGPSLYVKCSVIVGPGEAAEVASSISGASKRFLELFYSVLSVKSGRHHPDGLFWVRSPGVKPTVVADKLPLKNTTEILATLASLNPDLVEKHFGSARPEQCLSADEAVTQSDEALVK